MRILTSSQDCRRTFSLLVCIAAAVSGARAQLLVGGTGAAPRLFGTDMAVLEAGDPRKDLPCTVNHEKALLGFDLRFHATYDVSIPLRELAGSENLLTTLFRVTRLDTAGKPAGDPRYFSQRIRVPSVDEDAKGEASLGGAFDIGEGKFKVEWLMRDRQERVCSAFWEVEASLPPRDKGIKLMIDNGSIDATEAEQFRDDPPVARSSEAPPLNIKVLVNFAPQRSTAATLQPIDTSALISILRQISREPKIGKFSLVAFNLHHRKVLYKQANADKIDFPELGKAVNSLKLGTVDVAGLANKRSETDFLENLLVGEMSSDGPLDAIVFAGPKAMLEQNVSQESLKQIGHLDCPVFYMNYNLYPQVTPWRDSISHAVKFLKGMEYTISRPRDLWYAVSEMVTHIVKNKGTKGTSSPAGPTGQ